MMRELSPYLIRRTGVSPSAQPLLNGALAGEDRPEIGFWDLWRVIRTRRRLIVVFFLAVVLTVAVGTLLMTPIYTSESTLLIQEQVPQVIDFRQAVSESFSSEKHDFYATQAEILKSPSLVAQVIQGQHLESNRIFTGQEKTPSGQPWSILTAPVKAFFSTVKGVLSSGKKEASDPAATLKSLSDTYIRNYLEIKPVDNTRLLKIVINSPDPNLSA